MNLKYIKIKSFFLLVFNIYFLSNISCFAQGQVVDEIIAIVGGNVILKSNVESEYIRYLAQGNYHNDEVKCQIFRQLLLNELLLNQAILDSLEIPDSQIESELDRRLRFFINQIGSQEKLEEYYKKSIIEIKDDFKDVIREQLLIQKMQSEITKDIKATPADVKDFFNKTPPDSLPYINEEIEISQIVRIPPVNEQEKSSVKQKLEELRQRVIKGEDFSTLAILYSQDESSARKGGELGFVNRGELVPEFEAAAFSLKNTKEISNIIETKYGFHIIQLVERRGEQINVRHILLKPKILEADLVLARNFLDSISVLIKKDSLSFSEAAQKFSDDIETKNNGGLLINPQTGTTKFEPGQLDPTLFFQIDKLKINQVSAPMLMQTSDGKQAYRLLIVKSRTQPHRANIKEDYQNIQNIVLLYKQNEVLNNWVKKRRKTTFIQINREYLNNTCILDDWLQL